VLKGRLVFLAAEGPDGVALWSTDGSSGGTSKLGTIATTAYGADIAFLVRAGSTVYFLGGDPSHGLELWMSDGTVSGTRIVRDIAEGTAGSRPATAPGCSVGSIFYFVPWESDHGQQLWRTDGTAEGTRRVRLLDHDPSSWGGAACLATLDTTVLFSATDSIEGTGLWRTDGTEEGTRRISGVGIVRALGVLTGQVILASTSGLASFDGTDSLTDLTSVSGPVSAQSAGIVAGSRLYFPGQTSPSWSTELWVSDGTPEGTHALAGTIVTVLASAAARGGVVYLPGYDASHGTELWRSEGTPATTHMVADLNDGTLSSAPFGLKSVGDRVFFFANSCELNAVSLWLTDGSAAGTARLAQVLPGANLLVSAEDRVFFAGTGLDLGWELWVSNGTPEGTRVVRDIVPGAGGSEPSSLAWGGGNLYFVADDQVNGFQIWRSDGTSEGTQALEGLIPEQHLGPRPAGLTILGNKLLFFLDDGQDGQHLYVSDGTRAGTAELLGPSSGVRIAFPLGSSVRIGDVLYLGAQDSENGTRIWRTDGTPEGTYGIGPRYGASIIDGLIVMAIPTRTTTGFAFIGWDAAHGMEPWVSDGTLVGTHLAADVNPGPASAYPSIDACIISASDGTFFTNLYEPFHGHELWRSDGTEAGTHLVADLLPDGFFMRLWDGKWFGNLLAFNFSRFDGVLGTTFNSELWLTDGTPAGTRLVTEIIPPWWLAMPIPMIEHKGCLFLTGFEPQHGWELHRLCPSALRVPRRRLHRAPGY
jgi:ELWxxDGT repeat protein